MKNWSTILVMGTLLFSILFFFDENIQSAEGQKKIVASADQLPKHTYQLTAALEKLLENEAKFAEFAQKVYQDITNDLANCDITDKTTASEYHSTLAKIDITQGKYSEARKEIEQSRELGEKVEERFCKDLSAEMIAATKMTGAGNDENKQRAQFRQLLAEKLAKLPWETAAVYDFLKKISGSMAMLSENLLIGLIKSQIEPTISDSTIDAKNARQFITYYFVLHYFLPWKDEFLNVLNTALDQRKNTTVDIWKERQIDLKASDKLTPVIDQLFTNPKEILDGKDNDGNGFIDDIHGIAYDMEFNKTPELLFPLPKEPAAMSVELYQAFCDILGGVQNAGTIEAKKQIAAMSPEKIKSLTKGANLRTAFSHGTVVVGVAVKGNPCARILVARFTDDWSQTPKPPTVETTQKKYRMYKETVAYFKAQGARVVNMSWGVTMQSIVEELQEANGSEKNTEEQEKLAQQIYAVIKQGFREAIQSAPEILFVCASGNGNSDPFFKGYLPLSLGLPNILVVGAVNRAGEKSSYSNIGSGIAVYANGDNVETVMPGGIPFTGLGTSLAAPQLTNLAAKLLAIAPQLKVSEIIDLIKAGGDKSKDGQFLLYNPKKTLELLRESFKRSN
jgi:subtilisin family serine protease